MSDPEVLYHFISAGYGLDAIRDHRLKLSRLDQLNDPFEFSGVADFSQTQSFWEENRTTYANKFGFICFSAKWNHPLMWAHYAQSHHGIVLGYRRKTDIDEGKLREVEYVTEKLDGKSIESGQTKLSVSFLKKMTRTKADFWHYEEEFRFFDTLGRAVRVSMNGRFLYFYDMTEQFELAEVLLGQKVSQECADSVAQALADHAANVKLYDVKCSNSKFLMERHRK